MISNHQQLMEDEQTCPISDHNASLSRFTSSVEGWTIARCHMKRSPPYKAFAKSPMMEPSFGG